MNKYLIVAGRGYGKTNKALQLMRDCGAKRIAVVCPHKLMFEWIRNEITHHIYPNNNTFKSSAWTLELDDGTHIDFFTAENPDRLRGIPKYDAMFLYDIQMWHNMHTMATFNNAIFQVKDEGTIVVTSQDLYTPLLHELIEDVSFTKDTPGTRIDSKFANDLKIIYKK